jgi:MOSC domain-containing protein YiiM
VTARVLQLSIKPRTPGEPGLPKRAVARLQVTATGAAGDYNDYRTEKMPGDLDQALLLVTDEILAQLQREGWPVRPGDLGENVALTGVPESVMGPGTRLTIGEVTLEVSLACDPCTRLYSLPYVGAERGPAFLRALTKRRGWYARVLRPGEIEQDAPIQVTNR